MQEVASSFFAHVDSGAVSLEDAYTFYLNNAKDFFKDSRKRLLQIRGEEGDASYCTRTSATVGFPVGGLKYSLLRRHYPKSIFFYTRDYDIDIITPYYNSVELQFARRFASQGKQILFTINITGGNCYTHAVAGILKDKTLFVINTTNTPKFDLDEINKAINLIMQDKIVVVDVNADQSINLQDSVDEIFCVTWMLNALVENGGQDVTLDSLKKYLTTMDALKRGRTKNDFIIDKLNEFKGLYSVEGGRRRTRRHRKICSCSPDTGDCPRCKKDCTVDKMSCQDGGKRKTTKKWIQDVVSHMKEGAFTKQALAHHETPMQYAQDVLKHPKKHTLKTRRRAQFLKNIAKGKKSRKSSRSRK